VRLEFFGDDLESLRYFDPLTQISREEIVAVTLPPAGELGILKHRAKNSETVLATLLDYLPPERFFFCAGRNSLPSTPANTRCKFPP